MAAAVQTKLNDTNILEENNNRTTMSDQILAPDVVKEIFNLFNSSVSEMKDLCATSISCKYFRQIHIKMIKEEISSNFQNNVGKYFVDCATENKIPAMLYIMQNSDLFNQVDMEHLREAFFFAVFNDSTEAATLLMEHPKFEKFTERDFIHFRGDLGLARALCGPAEYGNAELMQKMLENSTYQQYFQDRLNAYGYVEGLENALFTASESQNLEVLKVLLQEPSSYSCIHLKERIKYTQAVENSKTQG